MSKDCKLSSMEIFQNIAMLNGRTEQEIEAYLSDPDLSLLLESMEAYAENFERQVFEQENAVTRKLLQRMGENLFRPTPAIAVTQSLQEIQIDKPLCLRRGHTIHVDNHQGRVSYKLVSNHILWPNPVHISLDKMRNKISFSITFNSALDLFELVNLLSDVGISVWLKGDNKSVGRCLSILSEIDSAAIDIRFLTADDMLVDARQIGDCRIRLGTSTSIAQRQTLADHTPLKLREHFIYPELQSGFTLGLRQHMPAQAIECKVVQMNLEVCGIQSIHLFEHVNLIGNYLHLARLATKDIAPQKLSEELCVRLQSDTPDLDSEQLYDIHRIDVHAIAVNEGNDASALQIDLEEFSLFRHSERNTCDLHCLTSFPDSPIGASQRYLVGGEVEVSNFRAELPSLVVMEYSQEKDNVSIEMSTLFQKNGSNVNYPVNLELHRLLALENVSLLQHKAESYINNLLFCANPEFLQNKQDSSARLQCVSVTNHIVHRGRGIAVRQISIQLNQSLEDMGHLVTIAIGIGEQLLLYSTEHLPWEVIIVDSAGIRLCKTRHET